jgi:hypothetical protein
MCSVLVLSKMVLLILVYYIAGHLPVYTDTTPGFLALWSLCPQQITDTTLDFVLLGSLSSTWFPRSHVPIVSTGCLWFALITGYSLILFTCDFYFALPRHKVQD